MNSDNSIWLDWERNLRKWGIAGGAVVALEAAGSLTVILAQLVYLSQPFVHPFLSDQHMDALARMLEDPCQTQAFTDLLRGRSR